MLSKYYSILTLRSDIFRVFAWSFWLTCLTQSTCVQSARSYFFIYFYLLFPMNGNAWPVWIFLKVWGPVSAGTRFRHARQSCVLNKKKTDLVTLSLFMAVSMLLNMQHPSSYCLRHSWLTPFRAISFNQLVGTDSTSWCSWPLLSSDRQMEPIINSRLVQRSRPKKTHLENAHGSFS